MRLELRWRWTWLKAYLRGMPLGYRKWRSYAEALGGLDGESL